MNSCPQESRCLSSQEWSRLENRYQSQINPWLDAYRTRRKRGQSHPVHDFLFEYYQFNRRSVSNWHPPLGVYLIGQAAGRFLQNKYFTANEHGVFLDPSLITDKVLSRVHWIKRLMEAAQSRNSQINCYGLHEWAMVYKTDEIRHQSTPLRLSTKKIAQTVESSTLRCTHYDAYRFFTDSAQPRNVLALDSEQRKQNEQFGCVHFNMDLFKWCYKLSPWISSELLLDCFLLAVQARELDMRASPYDLREYGYSAIPIETTEGRKCYRVEQKQISDRGRALGLRLQAELRNITRSTRSALS